jgi:transposase
MKYSGIDLHSNNSVVVVTDESDRIIVSRRVPNSLLSVLAVLEPYRHDVVGVVVEATYNWYWLVDGLQAAGYRMHLANPAAIKRYEGLAVAGGEASESGGHRHTHPADRQARALLA